MKPILTSFLDDDFYKFSMLNAVLDNKLGDLEVEYEFTNRDSDKKFLFTRKEFEEQLEQLCELVCTSDDIVYLCEYTKKYLGVTMCSQFISHLSGFHLHRKDVSFTLEDGDLSILIKGKLKDCIMFEVKLLSIINELHFSKMEFENVGKQLLADKITKFNEYGFKFIEFGTRRRFSYDNQDYVIGQLKDKAKHLLGTSNVHFAQKHDLPFKGTVAHEWFMLHSAIYQIHNANTYAMKNWIKTYNNGLSIMLSDTFTTEQFLKEYDVSFTNLGIGLRQDSGDPFEWANKVLKHYDELNVDPTTKCLFFSDSLNVEKANKIYEMYKYRIQTAFGIGTDLTNDVGVKALNVVIKMTRCNGFPLIKVSDTPGKTMCKDEKYKEFVLNYLNGV